LTGEIERQDPEPLTDDSSIVPSALLKVNVSWLCRPPEPVAVQVTFSPSFTLIVSGQSTVVSGRPLAVRFFSSAGSTASSVRTTVPGLKA
jgi:hypothetical protein